MNIDRYINYRTAKVCLLLIILIAVIILALRPILNISFPFLISLILSYFLSPIINILIKKGFKRISSIIITYIFTMIFLGILSYSIFPMFYKSLGEMIKSLPAISEMIRIILSEITIRYQISDLPDGIKESINQNINNITELINIAFLMIFEGIGVILSNIFFIVLIPFITFYMLNDSKYLKEKVLMYIPSNFRTDSLLTWYQTDLILKRFIRGELIIALIVGTLTATGMYAIGVKYSLVLGFIAGVTNLIPYLGPFIGVTPSILVALMESPILALKAVFVFFLIQQVESGIISPKIVGKSVGLHPITIIFIILLFEQFFGLIGMFFAVPITSVIIVIYNRIIIRLNRQEE